MKSIVTFHINEAKSLGNGMYTIEFGGTAASSTKARIRTNRNWTSPNVAKIVMNMDYTPKVAARKLREIGFECTNTDVSRTRSNWQKYGKWNR